MHVYIFTYKSPFSIVPEFVENELPFWPREYRITIISLAGKQNQYMNKVFNLPNVDAYAISAVNTIVFFKILISFINKEFINELIRCILYFPSKNIFIRIKELLRHEFSKFRYYYGLKRILCKTENPSERILFYSYWLGPGSSAAIRMKIKLRSKIKVDVISRAHGSDLYQYAHTSNYLPYLKQNIKKLDLVVPISDHGFNYLKLLKHTPKIKLARLGIIDFNTNNNLPTRNKIFNIISCSYLNSIKQVHFIIEALSLIDDIPICWRHIGGGPLEKDLENLSSTLLKNKVNIDYKFLRNLTNQQVISFYQNENINLFINSSRSEGIPVSFMEANCFGIPVIAPDVGGISEILKHKYNGILL